MFIICIFTAINSTNMYNYIYKVLINGLFDDRSVYKKHITLSLPYIYEQNLLLLIYPD